MTATRLGTVDGTGYLLMEDVTCDANFAEGLYVTDAGQVTMRDCSISAVGFAVFTEGGTGTPTLVAENCAAWGTAPSWDLGGIADRLTGCSGQGLSIEGESAVVTDHVVTGSCGTFGMRLAGSNNTIMGGQIACIANVGLWSDGAVCGRAANLKIIAELGDTTNLDEWAVQVTGANTDPEVMLDGIDICGPGTATVITYGCNSAPYDCAGAPCVDCDFGPGLPECDDPMYVSDSPCTDTACWPAEEDRLPQLFSTCTTPAGMWDVQVPIKTTRAVILSLPELATGGISDIWRPGGTYDCLVAAELNVWTDDPPSDVGATAVDLYDDATSATWALSVGAGGTVDTEWTYHNLVGFVTGATTSQIRGEIVSVTTPLTTVQASVTLRFP
jgi:hypothetical protein